MIIIDGYKESLKLDYYIKKFIDSNSGVLAIIQIGDDATSNKYISIKQKVGESLGIDTKLFKFSIDMSDESIREGIFNILKNPIYKGVIIQLPIPRKSLYSLLDIIPVEKDVDLLSSISQKNYYEGLSAFSPPVIRATEYLLDEMNFEYKDSKVLLIGNGFLVGKPLKKMLQDKGCFVTVTENYKVGDAYDKDLIILSAGVPNLVKGTDISSNTCVIDFGSTVVDGKTFGDLDMSCELTHLKWLMPSPKGMGPLVVRFLFMNMLNISLPK